MRPETVQVSREDLYKQVWSEPVIKAAQKYGITGTALSKICRKAGVPVPPVGYWQRVQFGYKPERPPLPPPKDGARPVISVEKRPARPKHDQEVEALVAREEEEKNRIRVAERLTHPHPLVRMTADVLRGRTPDQSGMLLRPWKEKCLDIRVSRDSLPRALRIMDALLKAIEARGFRISVTEGEKAGTYIELLGDKLAIALEEKVQRKDHVLTKAESEDKAKHGWSSAPRWDYEPAGILQFRIKEVWGDGTRKTWSDGRTQRVAETLNEVIAGLIVVAEAKRREQLEFERKRLEWGESERRRHELEQRRREEAEQLKGLEEEAALWTKSQQLRAYIDAVEQEALKQGHSPESGSRLHEWLEWARKHADRLDPLSVESAEADTAATDGKEDATTASL